jgi:hypothetical protein
MKSEILDDPTKSTGMAINCELSCDDPVLRSSST